VINFADVVAMLAANGVVGLAGADTHLAERPFGHFAVAGDGRQRRWIRQGGQRQRWVDALSRWQRSVWRSGTRWAPHD
jgi:hypothetical protein